MRLPYLQNVLVEEQKVTQYLLSEEHSEGKPAFFAAFGFTLLNEHMMHEHDRVIFTNDLPEYHLAAGDVGTVVHIYEHGAAYEVEVFTLDGHTFDVVTVEATYVRPVTQRDVQHARVLSA